MTFKDILCALLIPHICASYYFQVVKKQLKPAKIKLLNHLIYALLTLIIIKVFYINIEWHYPLTIIISHLLISSFICLAKKLIRLTQNQVFITDLILHLLTFILISYHMFLSSKNYQYTPVLLHTASITGIPVPVIFSFATKFLLIHKPANQFIVNLIRDYKPAENVKSENNIQSGRMIGTMERIIMLYFLSIDQYSSVGLVLTAKSIARYNKISESQEFAEYYLSGTLLSTICVLTISLI